jgi:hypothetical protein
MVTAGRAREIAHYIIAAAAAGHLRWDKQGDAIALALLDTAIETLEAWHTEHRSIRTHWMEYGKSDDCHECVAIERELTRLRAEREALTAGSRTIAE